MKKFKHEIALVVGFALMILSNGQFLMGWSAFLFPFMLLLSYNKDHKIRSIISLVGVTTFANGVSFSGMLPVVDIPWLGLLPYMAGSLLAVPFILQCIGFSRANYFVMTLILPATYALVDLVNATFNPYGSFGVLGYSQYQNLLVLQWASLVGVVGLTFLVTWVGSIAYWAIILGKGNGKTLIISSLVMVAMIGFSLYQLNRITATDVFQVTGIHTLDRRVDETAMLFHNYEANPKQFERDSKANFEDLIRLANESVQNGSDIISFAEATLVVSEASQPTYLAKLQDFAKENGVILVPPMYVITPEGEKDKNLLYMIDAQGTIGITHYKYGGNQFENSIEGNQIIQRVQTEKGVLSGIICWDKDFPQIVSQVGRLDVDTLFIPSADWEAISPYHTIISMFRGVENGTNTITQTVNGMSMITDANGRIISQMNHFMTDKWVMTGEIPQEGFKTLYPLISQYLGVVFGILALLPWLWIWIIRKAKDETRFNLPRGNAS